MEKNVKNSGTDDAGKDHDKCKIENKVDIDILPQGAHADIDYAQEERQCEQQPEAAQGEWTDMKDFWMHQRE